MKGDAARWMAAAWVAAGLAGCSGSGAGLDSSGQPLTGGGTAPVPLSADFDSIQANVFTPICSVCHIGADAPKGLMLDAQHSYALLVGVASSEEPSILRVSPGDPQNSYLVQKIEGHAAVGGQMPLDETPLPSATIAFIVQWITDGAQRGSTSGQAKQVFAIAAVAPEPGAVLPAAPSQIVIAFTRDLDATRVTGLAVRLERASSEAAASPVAIAADLQVPAANARAVVLTPHSALPPGSYQIVLSGEPGNQLAALDGTGLQDPPANAAGERVVASFAVQGGS